jgi:hypothetical protein
MPATVESSSEFALDTEQLLLHDVGAWLTRPQRRAKWLDEHSDRLLQDTFSCIVRLSSHTGLTNEQLLSLIGCSIDTTFADVPTPYLAQCAQYLRWLETLVGDLDLHVDKRLTLVGATRFSRAANHDLDQCTRIMNQAPFSPNHYLQLGEISQAWQAAFRALAGPQGDRARAIYDANPYTHPANPHLTPARIDMLSNPNVDRLLGPRVAARMEEHLQSCTVCAAVR